MNTLTADSIRTAALAYNSEYPEAREEILAARPVIRVHLENEDRYGRQIRAVVSPGLVAVCGGWIGAGDPEVKTLRRRDGRLTKTETARRATRFLGLDSAAVDVEYVEHGV